MKLYIIYSKEVITMITDYALWVYLLTIVFAFIFAIPLWIIASSLFYLEKGTFMESLPILSSGFLAFKFSRDIYDYGINMIPVYNLIEIIKWLFLFMCILDFYRWFKMNFYYYYYAKYKDRS